MSFSHYDEHGVRTSDHMHLLHIGARRATHCTTGDDYDDDDDEDDDSDGNDDDDNDLVFDEYTVSESESDDK